MMQLLVVLLLCVFSFSCIAENDVSVKALCKFYPTNSERNCNIALFSMTASFRLNGSIVVMNSKLCEPEAPVNADIAAVSRGECPFARKAENAYISGFKALIIVNTEDSVFPPGGENTGNQLVPTVLVGRSFWDFHKKTCSNVESSTCPDMSVYISYDAVASAYKKENSISQAPIDVRLHPVVIIGYSCVFAILLIVVMTATIRHLASPDASLSNEEVQYSPEPLQYQSLTSAAPRSKVAFTVICMLVILSVVGALRIATLRTRKIQPIMNTLQSAALRPPEPEVVYNHRETDEIIFEVISVACILVSIAILYYCSASCFISHFSSSHPPGLSKRTGIVELYQLSQENYGDVVFIHPPVFVYTMALLSHHLGFPLPLIAILYYLLTAVAIVPLTLIILKNMPTTQLEKNSQSTALWALVIYCTCPIAAFCSQKVWIDNAATFAVTISATVHIYLVSRSPSGSDKKLGRNQLASSTVVNSYLCQFMSGFVFGGLALNTKITCLALLPFLILWSFYALWYERVLSSTYHSRGWEELLKEGVLQVLCLLAGTVTGHGPWVIFYYISTGRLFPNAWPSRKMIENSTYLQGAIRKHVLSYATGLFAISPTHVLGLLFVVVVFASRVISSVVNTKQYEENRLSRVFSMQYVREVAMIVLSTWPAAFIGGLTLIGVLGGGYQIRFILPILPATSVLAAVVLVNAGPNVTPLVSILCCVSTMHMFYYSVLYSPLFADMNISVFEMIAHILCSMIDDQASKESMHKMFQTMKHYGLVIT